MNKYLPLCLALLASTAFAQDGRLPLDGNWSGRSDGG